MKKFLKSIMALSLAAVSLFSITACNDDYSEQLEDKYTDDGKLIISTFGHDLESMTGLTPDSKKILDYVENKFQIKFDVKSAPVSQSPTLLNQLIGGGDVPF